MITVICLVAGFSGLATFGIVAAGFTAKRTVTWEEEGTETGGVSGSAKKAGNGGILLPAHSH